jgi:purine-nucleoside phosphorylase
LTKIKESINYIQQVLNFGGNSMIVLGSGLGSFCDILSKKKVLPYHQIPHYPETTVKGHAGELVSGYFSGKEILIANGRFHFYEGFSNDQIEFPYNIFREIGVKNIIITNSSGSLNIKFKPGTLMAINGHLDCSFQKNEGNPNIISNDKYYSPFLLELAEKVALSLNIELVRGIYCWTLGPSYETSSEISYFKSLGGDAVGMSALPEIEICKKLGFSTLVISNLTNYGAGITKDVLNHEDVILNAMKNKEKINKLLATIIERI